MVEVMCNITKHSFNTTCVVGSQNPIQNQPLKPLKQKWGTDNVTKIVAHRNFNHVLTYIDICV